MRKSVRFLTLSCVLPLAFLQAARAQPSGKFDVDHPANFSGITPENADAMLAPYLSRAKKAPTAEEKARIYVALVTQLGSSYSSELSKQIVEIADLALACNLSLADRVSVDVKKGQAIHHGHGGARDAEMPKWRLEAAKVYLDGLQSVLDARRKFEIESGGFKPLADNTELLSQNPTEEQRREIGAFMKQHLDPRNQQLLEKYNEIERCLPLAKGAVTGSIADMYSLPPYDTPELESLLKSSISDESVRSDILERTKGMIASREKMAEQREAQYAANTIPQGPPLPPPDGDVHVSSRMQPTPAAPSPTPAAGPPQATGQAAAPPPARPDARAGTSPYLVGGACLVVGLICGGGIALVRRKGSGKR